MRVCVVGSGAREVALARAIRSSPKCTAVLCFGSAKNPAITEFAAAYEVGQLDNPEAVVTFCKSFQADMAIIGPEAPLAAGVVDALEAAGVTAIGPTKEMAQVESSKRFARDIMMNYNIAGLPMYKTFTSTEGMEQYITKELRGEYVVKADGLMGGKGVKVSGLHLASVAEGVAFAQEVFDKGQQVVIEEKCVGEEFSLMTFCDGSHFVHMPAVQDHKRAYVGDTGPNTGGMGSYSCADHLLPFMTPKDAAIAKEINETMAAALKESTGGRVFKGVLYGAFMCTKKGVACIEFNARFGDPEALNVLSLLSSDLLAILEAIASGTLTPELVTFAPKASVVKYACPFGYPDKPAKGEKIDISGVQNPAGLFLGAVDMVDGALVETGSRTVAVVATGESLREAEQACEAEVRRLKGNLFHRPDIGTEKVIAERVKRQQEIRRVKVGVVGSTRGSSLQPILYAIHDGELNASIEVVVSNIASSYILQRARVNNIKAVSLSGKGRTREDFDRDVTAALENAGVDLVLLVGFMRIVSGEFCRRWHGRMLNVHPSLLPKHAALMDLAVHQSVLDAGDSETGCTVHQVIEEVDGGATVVQLKVKVEADDTAETLKGKVQQLEGQALIAGIRMLAETGSLPGEEMEENKKRKIGGGDAMVE